MAKRSLSKNTIIDAALDLADKEGLKALSMRRLGEVLGVEAMSLYYHLPNKEALLDELVDRVYREMKRPPADLPWKQAIQVRAVSAHEVLDRHPWSAAVLDTRVNPGLETLGHLDAVIGCFRRAGFSLPLTAHAIALVDAFILGFAQQKRSLPWETGMDLETVAAALLSSPHIKPFGHMVDFVLNHALKPGYSFEDEFLWGLEAVLESLENRLAVEQAGPGKKTGP